MTHDYKRHGTTTLFAALHMTTGKVIGQCMSQQRHQEWLRFLRRIDVDTSRPLDVHLIADNYATHKHAWKPAWLTQHPRFDTRFTPTSPHGSTRASASSASSPAASAAACSKVSPNWLMPSTNTRRTTMPIQSPSCLDAARTRHLFAVASHRRRVQPHHDHPLRSSDNRPAPPHFHS